MMFDYLPAITLLVSGFCCFSAGVLLDSAILAMRHRGGAIPFLMRITAAIAMILIAISLAVSTTNILLLRGAATDSWGYPREMQA